MCVAAFGASASSMLSLLNLDFGSVTNVAAIEGSGELGGATCAMG